MKQKNTEVIKRFFDNVIIPFLLALLLFLLVAFTICNWGTDNGADHIRNVTSILTCITAMVSLVFSTYSRRKDFDNRRKERLNDINTKWYQTLIIDRHLTRLFSFYDLSSNLIDKFEEINKKKEEFAVKDYQEIIKAEILYSFTKEFTSFQQGLTTDALVINEELSKKILCHLQSFQDDYLSYLQNLDPNYTRIKNDIRDSQRGLLRVLKEYDLGVTIQ